MRGSGSASASPADLDQAIGTGQEYGAVGCTHAGGVDRPLAAYKLGVNGAVIAPHTNWRGEFSGGTYLQGSQSTAPVSWPGYSTTAWYQGKPPQEQNRVYMGTVLEGQRDASGQIYKRNRMYDPQTGQFTQTDPIGVAGGLNTYGFASGDPVSYSDPYGLCVLALPCPIGFIGELAAGAARLNAVGAAATTALVAGAAINRAHERERPNFRYHRRQSPTQTPEHARLQQESGELWGKAPRYGRTPAVQAFRGPLPAGVAGIEFATPVRPDSDGGALVYWSSGRPDVETFELNGEEYAKIPIVVTKNTQIPR
jgi:RHS repeat-associated protein